MFGGDPLPTVAAGGEQCISVADKGIDRVGIGRGIAGLNQPTAIADDFPDAWPVLSQYGATLGLSFQIHHAESLADARPHQEVAVSEFPGDLVLIEGAQKRYP